MNKRKYEELSIGDVVLICNGKNKGCYTKVKHNFIHDMSSSTGALVEIVPGETKRYHYKALKLIEDIEKEP